MKKIPQNTEKAPATVRSETEAKIASIKRRLAEIREYKKILAEDGLEPDAEDKERESSLIVQLLRLEKGLPAKAKPKAKKSKPRSKR